MPYADPQKNREYQRDYQQRWNRDNPQKRAEIIRRADAKRQGTPRRVRQLSEVHQRKHVRQKVAVIRQYGGHCAFCECDQFEYLTIDHVNGDGGIWRAGDARRYRGIYDYLSRSEHRPDLYRVLCWNCHMAMTRFGVMPGGQPLHDMAWWERFGALRRAPNRDSR